MVTKKGMSENSDHSFSITYRLVDFAIIQLVLFCSLYFYDVVYSQDYFVISLIANIAFFIAAESLYLYRSWRAGYFSQLLFYVGLAWGLSVIVVLAYLFFSKSSYIFSRVVIGLWISSTFVLFVGWRYVFSLVLENMRRSGRNTRKVAIMGLNNSAEKLAEEILAHPETGYRLDAIYDDRSKERLADNYKLLLKGNFAEGIDQARNNEYDVIFIALPVTAENRIQDLLIKLGDTTANVQWVPDLFIYSLMNASMSHVGDIQTISVYDSPIKGANMALKRIEDIVLSFIILTIICIPMFLIALGVKLTSRGPVLFKQDRYGLDGRKIKVWKFRSMSVMENTDTVTQATKNDPRVTRFGAFLRRTSLDELPQFFNVLAGDMSIVGPRPHAVAHNEEYRKKVDCYMLRHKVKPGITGWAQVNGWRGETDTLDKMERRVDHDMEYIRNWSLWLDFTIVVKTIVKSFTDKNAY